MAFSFFRRRQKLVVIIMAVLMISFLVGFQGFQLIFSRDPSERVVGTTRFGKLTAGEVAAARGDLDLLTEMGLGRSNPVSGPTPHDQAFAVLQTNEGNTVGTYALLQAEAARSGAIVLDEEIDSFFASQGYAGGDYEALISTIRSRHGLSEEQIRSVAGRWLRVYETFQQSLVSAPPSRQEVRLLFRDLNERVALRGVRFQAEQLLDEVPEPAPEQVVSHYNEFRARQPGVQPGAALETFGFGYRQPNRVRVAYLFLRREPIERVSEPSMEQMQEYFLDHAAEFTRSEPVEPPETEPATRDEPDLRTVRMSFSEARDEIRALLVQNATDARIRGVATRAQTLLAVFEERGLQGDPMAWVRSQLQRSAEDLLARKVEVAFSNRTLRRAIALLSNEAGIRICFPWGTHGERTWDPSLRVSLEPGSRTLGEALDLITEQIADLPPLDWAACEGLPDAIFPVAGVEMFPVSAGMTGWLDEEALAGHDLLGRTYTGPVEGQPLAAVAFMAKEFVGDRGLLTRGQTGVEMYVRGEPEGLLLWTLANLQAARVSPEATSPEQIPTPVAEQVRRDLKVKAGFELARRRAAALAEEARESGLEAAAEQAGVETFRTDLFSRVTLTQDPRGGVQVQPTFLPEFELASRAGYEQFMERAFSLTPESPEPPYPPSGVATVTLPPSRQVLVFERAEYAPALESEYQSFGQTVLARLLMMSRQQRALMTWFQWDQVRQRVDWRPEESS